ncbi:MAG TPA: hypothetical protein VHI99_27775 [Vicinamibacterales bacterium]|jgi:hypothetical protein|nr:hypothetical protein [Vicinamibacterales bacterium]
MHKAAAWFTLAAVLCLPTPAAAWGFEGHKYILDRAIPLLPREIRPFFLKFRVSIVEHTIDPDLWRTAGWEAENPRHFVDMDGYGPYPFTELPHDYDAAVAKYGKDFVEKNGLLPWRAQEIFDKLVDAFAQKAPYSRENIKFFSSILAHYVADAHVPFHAALNHDGQLTGQWGVHSRFESDLFDRYRVRLRVMPKPPTSTLTEARDFLFTTLTESYTSVQPILDADKAAIDSRDRYDDVYFGAFFGKVRPILEARLATSISDVASMIGSAWVKAGRPALPLTQTLPPKKVRRQ